MCFHFVTQFYLFLSLFLASTYQPNCRHFLFLLFPLALLPLPDIFLLLLIFLFLLLLLLLLFSFLLRPLCSLLPSLPSIPPRSLSSAFRPSSYFYVHPLLFIFALLPFSYSFSSSSSAILFSSCYSFASPPLLAIGRRFSITACRVHAVLIMIGSPHAFGYFFFCFSYIICINKGSFTS